LLDALGFMQLPRPTFSATHQPGCPPHLATEYAAHRIRFNAVAPGVVAISLRKDDIARAKPSLK
jgi:hypothetical protein